MDFQLTMLALLLLLNIELASTLEQDILNKAIGLIEKWMMEEVTMISYVKVVDNQVQPSTKTVKDTLDKLEAPKFTFNIEELNDEVRDYFTMQESGGIAIFTLPPVADGLELKNQIWTLDQSISGFKRCVSILIDEFGTTRVIFDVNKGRYQAPQKMHCPAVIIKPYR